MHWLLIFRQLNISTEEEQSQFYCSEIIRIARKVFLIQTKENDFQLCEAVLQQNLEALSIVLSLTLSILLHFVLKSNLQHILIDKQRLCVLCDNLIHFFQKRLLAISMIQKYKHFSLRHYSRYLCQNTIFSMCCLFVSNQYSFCSLRYVWINISFVKYPWPRIGQVAPATTLLQKV